jgi:hypothetical protein
MEQKRRTIKPINKIIRMTVLWMGLVWAFTTCAEARMNDRDALDLLRYIELQILAVDNDVSLPLGWASDDKKMIREFAKEGAEELTRLDKKLTAMDLSPKTEPVRQALSGMIHRYQTLLDNLHKKKDDDIKKAYIGIHDFSKSQSKKVGLIYQSYLDAEQMPESFDPKVEEARCAESPTDRKEYLKAVEMIKGDKLSEAIAIFKGLRGHYQGKPFWVCATLRLSDALIQREDSAEDIDGATQLLNDIVDSGIYAPVLAEAYEKWRSREQFMNHGMSNYSEIPNKDYNLKRLKLMSTIKVYLKLNPKDLWARVQINQILALPNINRGGEIGNDNIMYIYHLYGEGAL